MAAEIHMGYEPAYNEAVTEVVVLSIPGAGEFHEESAYVEGVLTTGSQIDSRLAILQSRIEGADLTLELPRNGQYS